MKPPMLNQVPRPLKILGIAIGCIVLLGLLLPYLVSVDSFRPRITSMIEAKTGRKVTIGNLRARFIPHLGFTASDVTLGSPAGFGDVALLKADTLKGALAWGPFLHGEYKIDSLDLIHPVVVMAEDEHERSNYSFSADEVKPGSRKNLASTDPPLELSAIDLTNAEFVSGHVVGAQRTLVPSMKITGIDVHLSGVTTQPGALRLWAARIPLSGVKVEVTGMKGPLTFRSGELALQGGHLDGTFDGAMGAALKAKGELHIPDIEKPVADVSLTTPLLDLDQLAAQGASEPAVGAAKARAAVSKDTALVAVIKAKADRVRYSPYEGTGAQAEIKIYDNRTEGPLTMAFYGGSLGLSVHLDSAQVPARFSANLQVSQVDLEKLLSVDPGTKGKMTGRGDVKMQLLGTLNNNPKNSLSGDGTYSLHNGKLPGVNLGQAMQTLSRFQEVLNFGQPGSSKGGETTYSLIGGDLSVRDGRIYTNGTHADTNMGSGDIRGSIGFDNTLALSGQWTLASGAAGTAGAGGTSGAGDLLNSILGQATHTKGGSLSVPFTVRGTLKDPKLNAGGGIPSLRGAAPAGTTPQQPPKKSLLDLFKP